MVILGYLAYPSIKLSIDNRHQIVSGLLEHIACEVNKTFATMYTPTIIIEDDKIEHITVVLHSYIHWEKDIKRILILKSDPQNQKENMCLSTEFPSKNVFIN